MTTRSVWNLRPIDYSKRATVRDWADDCDICGGTVGEDSLVCDEYGIAACVDCEPDAGK